MITDHERLNAKIFIVDDQHVNTMLLEKMLKKAFYTNIRSTNDSRQAEGIYMEYQPDLVLLDLSMPYLDGFQVMEQIRNLEKDFYTPILVLTAQPDENNRLRALKSGAKDFLGKPFNTSEVLVRIGNMLEVRLLSKQIREQNKLLEKEVRARTAELQETRLEVIRRLGRAGEYRDNETGNHVIRMSHYSALLAKEMGLDDKYCELILNASPMHDIGKIGIPDRILLKPGGLDEDEWQIMKTHVTMGEEILSGNDSPLMKLARTIALYHHEKWDGSGYVHGLNGDEIPIEARIVPVCDVFDALTTERPYKKAWSLDAAIAEMERLRGSHFEPTIVDRFKNILPKVLEIKKMYAEPTNELAEKT